MEETITIPKEQYNLLKQEIELLKDNTLLAKMNKLVDVLYQEKYGLVLTDFTDDLTSQAIQNSWSTDKSVWDDI